ncbi:MAG: hypothetical protein NDJ89_06885 [Oligoflexia bacterium]|nr:hypothetical protein [Oligoflexia bacterium]
MRAGLQIAVLFLGAHLGAGLPVETARGESGTHSSPCAEAYRDVAENNFRVGRNLESYLGLFSPEFEQEIRRLGPQHHWVDLGAGEGLAVEDYLTHFIKYSAAGPDEQGKARATAISYIVTRQDFTRHEKARLLKGRFFEDIPNEEIGKFDLATDLFGIAAYTPKLDVYLDKVLRLLNEDGSLFIAVGNPGLGGASLLKNEFHTSDGKTLNFVEWFKTIAGIEVIEHKNSMQIRIKDRLLIKVPRLILQSTDRARPPLRVFREIPREGR